MDKAINVLLSLFVFSYVYGMEEITEVHRTSIAKKFYYYCKLGDAQKLYQLRHYYNPEQLQHVWQDATALDCNLAKKDPLELAFAHETITTVFDITYELAQMYKGISLLHELINSGKNIKELLTIALEKKIDINSTAPESLHSYSPFGYYIVKNYAWIDHNDPVLQLFIKEGAHIKAREMRMGYNDNIFHSLIREKTWHDIEGILRIAKAICFLKLTPLYETIRENTNFHATQEICNESSELQEIKDALNQKNIWGNTVYDIFTTAFNLQEDNFTIFNPQQWQNNPLVQIRRCMPIQKK